MAVESVSGCSWSECPDQRGITVRMCVEWVSESAWNPQTTSFPELAASATLRSLAMLLTVLVLHWYLNRSM
ncbi:hypothetical protein ACRCRN_32840, partial [Pseudomonas aeruginosa]